MSMYSRVSEMNLAFGNPFGVDEPKPISNQITNILDEYHELVSAILTRNMVQVRDACCDILVFDYGAYHFIGIPASVVDSYEYPTIEPRQDDESKWAALYHLVNDSSFFPLYYNALGKPSPETLKPILDFAIGVMQLIGANVEADMQAVYDSNMSKFCKNQEELDATLAKYSTIQVRIEGEFPTKCVKSSLTQIVGGVSYPEGKFLKGVSYKPPVFA